MKIEKSRLILQKASDLYARNGLQEKADAILKLVEFLRDYDSKTVATFVKSHKARENRAK